MGLWQKAVETYDLNVEMVGVYRAGHAPLVPIGHGITDADIEILIHADGTFISATKTQEKIIFPVTQESSGRSSNPCAHPLCDNLGYVALLLNEDSNSDNKEKIKKENDKRREKHGLFVKGLEEWERSPQTHPILKAVLDYVNKESILFDLKNAGLKYKEDDMVCWRVVGLPEDEEEACWKNQNLFRLYNEYYHSQLIRKEKGICMISGQKETLADQHAKGVFNLAGNAKLISSNDKAGYTFRGRFLTDAQAETIGYITSQKVHNALRWIVTEQKSFFGKKAFVCWNPSGRYVPKLTDPFGFNVEEEIVEPSLYRKQLQKTLSGYQTNLPIGTEVVIASFEAATPGRLSVTYYNELQASDFLQRLYDWDAYCCWYFGYPSRIRSPEFKLIVDCAFGHEREKNNMIFLQTDDELLSRQVERLVSCRINKAIIPLDIRDALVKRASSPLAFSVSVRRKILSTACAVLRKDYHDRKGEDWEMALDPEKQDLSYQYGRLLAVLEKAETDTYGAEDSSRESNAVRMQAVFCQKPQYAAARILEQLKRAYFPRLKPGARVHYEQLIGNIMEKIDSLADGDQNRPLKDTYLMGYYLQKNELYKSNKEKMKEEENHDAEE